MGQGTLKRRLVAAVGAFAVAALAVACTGPEPVVTVDVSPTGAPSVSASPSPTPLTDADLLALLPVQAAHEDLRGAVATAEYFVALTENLNNGEAWDEWAALSTEECNFCSNVLEGAVEHHDAGGSQTGGRVVLRTGQTRGALDPESGKAGVRLKFTEEANTEVYGDGSSAQFEASEVTVEIELILIGEVWRVNGLEITSVD